MHTTEEWRTIPRYPDYEVSNLGRVRSWRNKGGSVRSKPYLMTDRQQRGKKYRIIGLRPPGEQARGHPAFVHHLVAEAFIGPRPGPAHLIHVCHGDGDPTNNALSNLRYDTTFGNAQDSIRHGTHPSLAAKAKTHCKHGHEYTAENTGIQTNTNNGRPARFCITCKRERADAAKDRRNARKRANRAALRAA